MQDWLTRNRLDRSTLSDLQDNLAAVEEYQVELMVVPPPGRNVTPPLS